MRAGLVIVTLSAVLSGDSVWAESLGDIPEVVERFEKLQYSQCRYSVVEHHQPSITPEQLEHYNLALRKAGNQITLPPPRRGFTCFWKCAGDKLRFENRATAESLKTEHAEKLRIVAIYNGRMDLLIQQPKDEKPIGGIVHAAEYPAAYIDVALGLRLFNAPRPMSKIDLEQSQVLSRDEKLLRATRRIGRREFTFELLPQRGYALKRCLVTNDQGLVFSCEATGELPDSEVPVAEKFTLSWRNPTALTTKPFKMVEVSLTEFSLHEPVEQDFALVWPNGTDVHDGRHEASFGIRRGDQTLTEAQIEARLQRMGRTK